MQDEELTHPYAPNPALAALYRRLFDKIQVEEGWAEEVRALSKTSKVLYVLPNLNWLDFVALDYLVKRHELPPIRYANDLGLWLLNPKGPNVHGAGLRGYGLWNMLVPSRRKNPERELRDAIDHDGSAALFLKRPPSMLDVATGVSRGRGMQEGDDLVRAIFRIQEEAEHDLVLMPLVFVWSKSPDPVGGKPWDYLLGAHAYPTPTRALSQIAYNLKYISLRFAEPISVRELIESTRDLTEETRVRRITYMVLTRIERERRAVVGPAAKAAERVRTEIVRSPRLGAVIQDIAGGDKALARQKAEEALSMLEELQAQPNPNVIKGMGMLLRWGFNRIYRGIEFDAADVERVRKASKEGTLLLLPSHKSHIDYLILSYFFYEHNLPMPTIAAGDNLNFKPVGPIFRRCGAFFIRRSFKGDRLYAAVVDAYIRRLIRDGYPIELFLEGGRSRTGKLLEPKFGLLNMIVDAALAVPTQKVQFVPVSIGYERVVEADSYQRELSGAEKKQEEAADLLGASEVLRHSYGRINLQFGQILTLDEIRSDLGLEPDALSRPAKRRAVVTRLGNRVMDEINRVTAVAPGSLTATALLSTENATTSEEELIATAARLLSVAERAGARVTTPMLTFDGALRGQSIREALGMFEDTELLVLSPGSPGAGRDVRAVPDKRMQLDTSKNIILHFFVERALVAASLDRVDGRFVPTDRATVARRVLWASRLFKHEFRFRADAPFEEILEQTCHEMIEQGHLALASDTEGAARLAPGPGELGWSGDEWLVRYVRLLGAFFESYWITAKSLDALLDDAKTDKDLEKLVLARGRELLSNSSARHPESVSRPLIKNALLAFTELGAIRARSGKLELDQSHASLGALDELARTIHGYLSGRHEVGT